MPIVLLLNFFFPQLLTPLLMIGGSFVCFEGVETILYKVFNKEDVKAMEQEHVKRIKDESLSEEEIIHQEKGFSNAFSWWFYCTSWNSSI